MNLIDNEGRLFGRVNVIDLLIILLLLLFIPSGYFVFKSSKKPQNHIYRQFINAEINCKFININKAIMNNIKIGDIEKDINGNEIGKIVWVGNFQDKFVSINLGNIITVTENKFVELPVRIKAKLKLEESNLYYKNFQIYLNSKFKFETDKYQLETMIIEPEKWIKIKIKFLNIPIEMSKIINSGFVEKNSNGKVIGKLIKILDSKQSVNNKNWSHDKIFDNTYDFIMIFEILCDQKNNELFYKNSIVKIGSSLSFSSDKFFINGTIIDFKSDEESL